MTLNSSKLRLEAAQRVITSCSDSGQEITTRSRSPRTAGGCNWEAMVGHGNSICYICAYMHTHTESARPNLVFLYFKRKAEWKPWIRSISGIAWTTRDPEFAAVTRRATQATPMSARRAANTSGGTPSLHAAQPRSALSAARAQHNFHQVDDRKRRLAL